MRKLYFIIFIIFGCGNADTDLFSSNIDGNNIDAKTALDSGIDAAGQSANIIEGGKSVVDGGKVVDSGRLNKPSLKPQQGLNVENNDASIDRYIDGANYVDVINIDDASYDIADVKADESGIVDSGYDDADADADADAGVDDMDAGTVCEFNLCEGICADLNTDPNNCGHCGNSCDAGEVCQKGECAGFCTGLTTDCNGECVDLNVHPNNCGKCGHDCLGGNCENGQCFPVVVASNQNYPLDIIQDDNSIYWVNAAEKIGQVVSASKDNNSVKVLANNQDKPIRLTQANNKFYWVNQGSGDINSFDPEQNKRQVVAESAEGPYGLAVNETYIFWGEIDAQRIVKKTIASNEITTIATTSFYPHWLHINGSHIYWKDAGIRRQLVNDTENNSQTIFGRGGSAQFVLDSGYFYLTQNGATPRIWKVENKPGATQVVLTYTSWGEGIATYGDWVYWADTAEGTINRVRKNGVDDQVLASDQENPKRLIVDEEAIYWTNNIENGSVNKLAKYD